MAEPWVCPWGICNHEQAQGCRANTHAGKYGLPTRCGGRFPPETTADQAKRMIQPPAPGVIAPPAPNTRKPWERTDWNCALARVDHEGLHCPDTGRCADCPNGMPPCRGPLTKDEVDALVYQCRQAGDDSTYALVRAIEAALGVGGRDAT